MVLLGMCRSGKQTKLLDKETRRIYLQRGVTSKERVALSNSKDYIWTVNKTVGIWREKIGSRSCRRIAYL